MTASIPNQTSSQAQTTTYSWSQWQEVSPRWRAVFDHSPYRSFFLSVDWIETWLSIFGAQLNPEVLVIEQDGRAVGCCLLVHRTVRVGVFLIRRVYLNASGEDEKDETYIEFNDLLAVPGYEEQVAQAIFEHVQKRRWDEFVLDGCIRSAAIDAMLATFGDMPVALRREPAYYVPLSEVRSGTVPFERSLSKNTRHNLKRTLKAYDQIGPRRLEVACDTETALEMLDELATLHQQRWTARDHPGVFSSPRFCEFNRALVRRLHPEGKIQLMRVSAGAEVVGVISNLVLDGRIYFYLCGFSYGSDNNLRPGMITVFSAIEHSLEQGFSEFDLMAGDVQYKKSFSELFRELHWFVVRRPSLKVSAIDAIRSMRKASVESKGEPPKEAE